MSLLFEFFYLVGFTPWDRGDMWTPRRLRDAIEGPDKLVPGRALDLGCGMGRHAIYLAQHGWQVTGVDAVERALRVARRRAAERKLAVDFIRGDVTRLDRVGVAGPFAFLLDSGCFHGMADDARRRYGESIARVAAPDAVLLMLAFGHRKGGFGPRGAERADIEQSLSGTWRIESTAPADDLRRLPSGITTATWYWLQRTRPEGE